MDPQRTNPAYWFLRRLPNDKNIVEHLRKTQPKDRRSGLVADSRTADGCAALLASSGFERDTFTIQQRSWCDKVRTPTEFGDGAQIASMETLAPIASATRRRSLMSPVAITSPAPRPQLLLRHRQCPRCLLGHRQFRRLWLVARSSSRFGNLSRAAPAEPGYCFARLVPRPPRELSARFLAVVRSDAMPRHAGRYGRRRLGQQCRRSDQPRLVKRCCEWSR